MQYEFGSEASVKKKEQRTGRHCGQCQLCSDNKAGIVIHWYLSIVVHWYLSTGCGSIFIPDECVGNAECIP
jgi:hypothetical protein